MNKELLDGVDITASIDMHKYLNTIRKLKVTYMHGETGAGKTARVYNKTKNKSLFRLTTYKKTGKNFDNYDGEEILVLDNFNSSIDIDSLNDILDGYPLFLPSRYQDRVACYKEVYILSRFPISEQFKYEQVYAPEKYQAFLRRITAIEGVKKHE